MHRMIVFLALIAMTMQSVALQTSWATDCSNNAYGVSTLRSDAQCPPGGCTGFGVIEITPPDEFVYGVIDGSVIPQQFLFIKTKLRSLLTRDIRSGKLWASARFRKRTDYQPDLSTDPPSPENIEDHFSASLSVPIEIDELSSDSPKTYVFDFSSDPIPAGITDLYLIITFIGEIEGLEGPNAAIGIKDLNEPHHITVWNLTDYFVYFEELRTGESLWYDQEARLLMDEVCEGMDLFVFPEEKTDLFVGFNATGSEEPPYVISFIDLPAGRYGRVISLTEGEAFMSYVREVPESGIPGYISRQINAVVNQYDGKDFNATTPFSYRSIKTHEIRGFFFSCPFFTYTADEFVKIRELYTDVAPVDSEPVSTSSVDFP